MSRARVTLDRDFIVGEVPRRLFGSFVEHMGRCVYTGIYEPGHPTADEQGFRRDVLDLVKELGATVIRYPGGNFVSGLRLGGRRRPGRDRPRRLDGAWHTVETNAFGLHEFVDWSRVAGVEVMEAVNLGTRGRRRGPRARRVRQPPRRHRAVGPRGARTATTTRSTSSCGAWATRWTARGRSAHKTADEYGRLAAEAGQGHAAGGPDASSWSPAARSNSGMPTFGAWEQTVLGARLRPGRLRLAARLLPGARRRRTRASWPARSTWTTSSSRSSRRPTPSARRASTRSTSTSRSTSGTSGTRRGRDTEDQPHVIEKAGVWKEHPRIIEDEYSSPTRSSSAPCSTRCCGTATA